MTHESLTALPSPEECTDIAPEEFGARIRQRHEPLVIRGLARTWDIVDAAQTSADAVADYLGEFDAGRELPLVITDAKSGGRLFYNDDFSDFNFKRQPSTLSAGLALMGPGSEEAEKPSVFFQCVPVSEAVPGMRSRLPNPLVPPDTRPHIWIGSRVRVAAHFDEAKNIAVVAAGRRRFTLFPPGEIHNLYIGPLDFTPAGQPISLVDMNAPDFERFPRYAKALETALSVELAPGDAIYIPAPWWHHVESLESLNVLVNFWWDGAYAASGLPFTALIHAIQAFRHLNDAERDAWKHLVDHYAFEVNGDPAEHLSPHDPGLLGPMTPQLARHIDRWLARQIGPAK